MKSSEQDSSGSVKEEKTRLKMEKKVFLREVGDGTDYAYAYDTKLKKVVIVNPHNKCITMAVAN